MGIFGNLVDILKRSRVKKRVFLLLFLLAAGSSFLEILPSRVIGSFSDALVSEGNGMLAVLTWHWISVLLELIAQGNRKRCVVLVTHKEHPAFSRAEARRISI